MIKLINPLNKDGVLYEAGCTLSLGEKVENEMVKNGVAMKHESVKVELEVTPTEKEADEYSAKRVEQEIIANGQEETPKRNGRKKE